MAAPTPSSVGTPAGLPLKEGQGHTITFSRLSTLSLWEATFKPPGLDGGDAVDQTTQRNVTYRVMAPRRLVTLTEITGSAAYDPNAYNQILTSLLNAEGTVTVRFNDGSTLAFYGFLRVFEPDELSEGEQPRASFTITPTNWDHANDVESGPVLTSVAGT